MTRKMDYGPWAQVVGVYNLETRKGEISSMMPARIAFASEGGEERVRLRGLDVSGETLFDLAVNPLTPSCGVVGDQRSFEEYVPVAPELVTVRLYIDGKPAADYAPGSPKRRGKLAMGSLSEGGHRLSIEGDVVEEPGVTYVLQVRPEGDKRWHTMAAGLPRPDVAAVDINQFPGATALDVRVLRNNGLETTEVLNERREFDVK